MNGLCHLEIPADDIESLQGFYSSLFGWNFKKVPGDMEYHILEPQVPEMLGIGMMKRQHPQQPIVPYILVEEVTRSLEKALSLGATAIMPRTVVPGMGWFAVFMDPQGNAVGIWQTDEKAS